MNRQMVCTDPLMGNCPLRIPVASSLSRMEPNLIKDLSVTLLKLGFADFSKLSIMVPMSSLFPYLEFFSFSAKRLDGTGQGCWYILSR